MAPTSSPVFWRRRLALPLAVVLVWLVQVWVVSAGRMVSWPPIQQYKDAYAPLGEAFLHGQTHLLEQPAPELLALPDPYDCEANLRYRLHDRSLYHGHYYLYWGPVPALLAAAVSLVGRGAILTDQHLTFLFVSGVMLFGALVLCEIRRQCFPALPRWVVLPGVLVLGLGNPMPYLLARPAVYEAASSGGQCFLLAGLYCALLACRGEGRKRPLLLAGACWALAVGCRLSLAPAAAVLALVTLARLWARARQGPEWRGWLPAGAVLLCPLALGAASLALYNFARFGSFFETGLRYQLAGWKLQPHQHELFSPSYVLLNAYRYLLAPVTFFPRFPFLEAANGPYKWPQGLTVPALYQAGRLPGILRVSPFVVLAVIPLLLAIGRACRRLWAGRAAPGTVPETQGATFWVMLFLMAALLGMVPVLCNISCEWRYLADLMPSLFLVAAVGFLQVASALWRWRVASGLWLLVTGALATLTCLSGVLMATVESDLFPRNNPRLYERLVRATLWRPVLTELTNDNGVGRRDGQPFFWLGRGDTVLGVLLPEDGRLDLEAIFEPGPSVPNASDRRLLIKSDSGWEQQVTVAPGYGVIHLPVRAGATRFALRSLDRPVPGLPPGPGPWPVVLGVQGMRLTLWTKSGRCRRVIPDTPADRQERSAH